MFSVEWGATGGYSRGRGIKLRHASGVRLAIRCVMTSLKGNLREVGCLGSGCGGVPTAGTDREEYLGVFFFRPPGGRLTPTVP